jgi:hypothetical protein
MWAMGTVRMIQMQMMHMPTKLRAMVELGRAVNGPGRKSAGGPCR